VAGASDRTNTSTLVVVVVAIVGLLATVGAAALGGYWANKSVEREIESQRSAEIKDQRREVYVAYLRAATRACEVRGNGDDAEITHAANEVLTEQGLVLLVAGGPALKKAVTDFTDALDDPRGRVCDDVAVFQRFRDAFVEAAQPDL
jgi:hypothetical protein